MMKLAEKRLLEIKLAKDGSKICLPGDHAGRSSGRDDLESRALTLILALDGANYIAT